MLISLDLETTGVEAQKDKIIEFGAVKFDLKGNQKTLQFFCDPGIPIPQIITHITNITDEDIKGAPKFEDKMAEVQEFIGDLPIIGHNIQFDTGFLRENGIPLKNPEYDTFELSTILSPGLPSYSLEILSEIFKVQHKEKHRALDDALAAMELFTKLIENFQALPKELIHKIHSLCEKTGWPLKNLLLQFPPINKKQEHLIETPQQPEAQIQIQHLKELNSTGHTFLIEKKPPYDSLAKELIKTIDQDSYIALSDKLFKRVEKELPDNISKLDSPERYLSTNRLKEYESKDFYKDYEFAALLKYLILQEKSQTGLLDEIKFINEEGKTITEVNIDKSECDLEKEPFFQKALKKDKNKPALCTHRYVITEKPKIKDILIFNLEEFTQSLQFESTIYLKLDLVLTPLQKLKDANPENHTIDSLISKTTILFGLIGVLFEKYNDRNSFYARLLTTNLEIDTKEWESIKNSIKNLIEISKELGEIVNEKTKIPLQAWKEKLMKLHSIFIEPGLNSSTIVIEKNLWEDIVIKKMINNLETPLKEILDNFKNYKIISENLDLNDNGKFIKKLYGLDNDIPLLIENSFNEDINIYITNDIPEKSFRDDEATELIIKNIMKKRGNTAIILNSKQKLQQFTLKLSEKLPKDIQIVSQLTGSIGKLQEKFKKDPDNSILLVTPIFWQKFKDHKLVHNLYIHKTPFEAPSSDFLTTNSTIFQNPFMELQVPQAIFELKKIINRITKGEIIILDSRLITKKYGNNFFEQLNKLGKTEIVNTASLTPISQDE